MEHVRGNNAMGSASWRICALIVGFHPDEAFWDRVLKIDGQVEGTVIVDNGSAPPILSRLPNLASGRRIHVIENPQNLGIGTALNQGLAYATEQGYTHGLLFDQDTEPFQHLVSSIRQAASGRADLERVAVIGINSLDGSLRRRLYRFPPGDPAAREVDTVVTSGSLVSLQIAARLGHFREELFIDFVDDEYCLRARSKGFKILLIPEPLAVHVLGSPKIHRLPWRTIGTSNHAAIRRYYMTRNHVVLVKEYAFREPGWVLRSLYARLKSLFLLLLFDDDRLLKMRFMWRGLIDGMAGRMGELPRY